MSTGRSMVQGHVFGSRMARGVGRLTAIAMLTALSACASRTVVVEEPSRAADVAPLPRTEPQSPPKGYGNRQGVGINPGWTDDPAKRVGPQGQPAPYGRDTITGRPITDLNAGTPALPAPRYIMPPKATTAATPPATPAAAAPLAGSTVVVGKGETLYSLARRHNVKVEALMKANNLSADKIQAGQTLILPAN